MTAISNERDRDFGIGAGCVCVCVCDIPLQHFFFSFLNWCLFCSGQFLILRFVSKVDDDDKFIFRWGLIWQGMSKVFGAILTSFTEAEMNVKYVLIDLFYFFKLFTL